ncbi:MAG: cytochrome C oxidase subunit IV family protein [Phycisphaeraceae bacterium]|nr:cytochrome C oxidase subunit IV family protein [Phycisphaeraceae bacterium]
MKPSTPSRSLDAAAAFDPTDPHGFHAHDTHGHHIVSLRTLLIVLSWLLVFTILTVFASRFEIWIAQAFKVEVPQSVNVLIAMSIAVIKGLLVVLFFMQLKYDSKLNSIIFAFCLLTVGIFLGFTALDLFSRDAIDRVKKHEIVAGGSGNFNRSEWHYDKDGQWVFGSVQVDSNVSVAEHARVRAREDGHAEHHDESGPAVSTANRSLQMTGLMVFAPKEDHAEPEDH